jgi:hypothetical protein
MTTWPYYPQCSYHPHWFHYAPIRTEMAGPTGMSPGMQHGMMDPEHMQNMMAMMREHMELTRKIYEKVERVEQHVMKMENKVKP